MNLIIEASLSEPPTQVLPFRDFTWRAKKKLGRSILIECDETEKDLYWKFMKPRGMFDFVDQLVSQREGVFGFRIINRGGSTFSIAPSMLVDRIDQFNHAEILEKITRF